MTCTTEFYTASNNTGTFQTDDHLCRTPFCGFILRVRAKLHNDEEDVAVDMFLFHPVRSEPIRNRLAMMAIIGMLLGTCEQPGTP